MIIIPISRTMICDYLVPTVMNRLRKANQYLSRPREGTLGHLQSSARFVSTSITKVEMSKKTSLISSYISRLKVEKSSRRPIGYSVITYASV